MIRVLMFKSSWLDVIMSCCIVVVLGIFIVVKTRIMFNGSNDDLGIIFCGLCLFVLIIYVLVKFVRRK